MNTQHTPGPWRRKSAQTASPWHIDAGEGPTYRMIARVHDAYTADDSSHANARLIAAAPDLLAAASDALESLRRLPNAPDAFRVTCIAQLSAAIAKATGAYGASDPTVTYAGFGDGSHSPYCECYQCVEVEA